MTTPRRKKIEGLRWYVAGLLCLATALNYLDRQILALLGPTLEREIGINTIQYSYITTAFLVSYTLMYAVSGRVIDRLGARRGFAIAVCAWSGADLTHAFARTARQFALCRFLLGAAEPANFPAGIKAVSEWFPVRERALAVGIFNSGTAIGAGLAAPLVALIALSLGWRWTFVVSAGLGVAWVVLWLLVYRSPRQHPRLGDDELRLIEEGAPPPAEAPPPVPLRRILRQPEAWGCILARVATDPLSYFFAFWMPKFLQQERGFDLAAIGRYYWIPYLGLGIGNIASGAVPRWLIGRGWSINRSRKLVMFAASCLMPVCFILITRVANPAWAVALIGVAMFSHASWGNIILPAEVFPSYCVGMVTGCGGAAGSLISAFAMLGIGRIVTAVSFTPVFLIYSAAPMTGFVLVCLLIRKLGRIRPI